ncbi:MAG: hypothetical protein COX65_08430 [Elusimicrobia bacterium CG_4_10_14_0_2_um_filter_56_8]|nr:MAG: hypothetical protein AUJ51_09930 [Elusimicrobia bacterium CG1_02_56_21]PJA12550.1 MAG: hypothetical protein COX65_08430 [Elusimicrobia bacterium CG_4_10_14_0_2_um_filter_56_8]
MTLQETRVKKQLERLLKKRRYRHDDRTDHREWWKSNSAFAVDIRPDQNNPDGLNGFECAITTYMRRAISPQDIEALLVFMKKEFP